MTYQIFLLRILNSGGNGDIWLAQRSDTGAQVVVKFLREFHLEYGRKAFAREVRILNQNLPGMIAIIFADLKAEKPYYVMPYLAGGSTTKHSGRLTAQQVMAVAHESARSLSALHARHIAHGDFKPDNLLITDEGNLRLADPLGNGIGCTVLFSQNHGGTPGYWAPEIKRGAPISQAGDVYSYGVTLHQLITGVRPQDGRSLDLSHHFFQNNPHLAELISACCDPVPAERPSMREVLRMLEGVSWAAILDERKEKGLFAVCAIALVGVLCIAVAK